MLFYLQVVLIILILVLIILFLLFLLSSTENYLSLLSLYQKMIIANYQNFLSHDFKDHIIGMNEKENARIPQMSADILSNQTFYKLFVLIYLNQNDNVRRYRALKYYLIKGIIKN